MDPITVECIQEKAQSALEEYERFQYLHHQPFRFGRLLLRLPRLKLVTGYILQRIFFPHMDEDRSSVEQLIKELLLREPPLPPPPPPPPLPPPLPPPTNSNPSLHGRSPFDTDFTEWPGSTFPTPTTVTPQFPSGLGFDCDMNLFPIDPGQKSALPCWSPNSRTGIELTAHPGLDSNLFGTTKLNFMDPDWCIRNRNPFLMHPALMTFGYGQVHLPSGPLESSKPRTNKPPVSRDEPLTEDLIGSEISAFAPIQTNTPLTSGKVSSVCSSWHHLKRVDSAHKSPSSVNAVVGDNKHLNPECMQSIRRPVTTDAPIHRTFTEPGRDRIGLCSKPAAATTITTTTAAATPVSRTSFPSSQQIPQIPFNQTLANPATLQLYYAVMRHQLSLLQKHTTSVLFHEKQTEKSGPN
ncbi:unnamed protein product [Echinostoma caproni]|uniref:NR LBD domain-containing protein n=1 Tax=Echinostoma caproni TaxID=27848 RepID=A0A183ASL3_9TREM|nr:unnamed protein product [Echinostoma caproni]